MNDGLEQPVMAAESTDVPESRVDFNRKLVCILGLPFDVMGLDEAVHRIRADAFAKRRCFVSTPNLNFVITARADAEFRASVFRSDLTLVDGMPLVWIARLLGLPIRERAAGADLFEALQAHNGPPVTVFVFGGAPGIAALACEGINKRGGGVRCVGFDSAGFGSIEEMSSDEQIARINRSDAQFVVVALGAKKGQAWIEHNARRLTAPVLSHLGAVINFAAGTVGRAPVWIRRCGLEWLWRVKEEPVLWRRYWNDGLAALALLVTRVLPDALESRRDSAMASLPTTVKRRRRGDGSTLQLKGDFRGDAGGLRQALTDCATAGERVTIDMGRVTRMGSSLIGLLLLAHGWFDTHGGFEVIGLNRNLAATLKRKLADRSLQ